MGQNQIHMHGMDYQNKVEEFSTMELKYANQNKAKDVIHTLGVQYEFGVEIFVSNKYPLRKTVLENEYITKEKFMQIIKKYMSDELYVCSKEFVIDAWTSYYSSEVCFAFNKNEISYDVYSYINMAYQANNILDAMGRYGLFIQDENFLDGYKMIEICLDDN